MPPVEAKRTLVKSPPEVWAQVSDVACLAEQLGAFGEIRITRAEPETIVEWEGDRATGTVRLESSGWGTKVTLTAEVAEPGPVAEIPSPGPATVPGPSPVGDPAPPAPTPDPMPSPAPDPVPEPTPDPVPEPTPDPVPEPTPDTPDVPEVEPPIREPAPEPPAAKAGFWKRLFGRKATAAGPDADVDPTSASEPSFNEVFEAVGAETTHEPSAPEPEPEPEPEPVEEDPVPVVALEPEPLPQELVDTPPEPEIDALAVLTGTLEHLGAAHHRPFSRG